MVIEDRTFDSTRSCVPAVHRRPPDRTRPHSNHSSGLTWKKLLSDTGQSSPGVDNQIKPQARSSPSFNDLPGILGGMAVAVMFAVGCAAGGQTLRRHAPLDIY